MAKSNEINELAAALVSAQGDFPTVHKDSNNPFFKSKYAGLPEVMAAASPVLTKHGLAISQFVTGDGLNHYLTTYLLHKSGQYIAHDMELLLSRQDAQGQGSAITYARRYSYMAVLGLVADEDDDGNAASPQTPKPAATQYKPTTKAAAPSYDSEMGIASRRSPGLITPASMTELKTLLAKTGQTGDKAIEFSQFIIGKSKPESESEVQELLAVLRAK
jgi:hypothetical protein